MHPEIKFNRRFNYIQFSIEILHIWTYIPPNPNEKILEYVY